MEEPVFHLDAETGVLKGTDGREVVLEERVVRVLVALAGEISGAGRRQPFEKLSDGAVASLYSGARREWTPEEAAKIAYQFTRSLRRSLSRADIRDRDAIVRRLRETGIAMGTRWGVRRFVEGPRSGSFSGAAGISPLRIREADAARAWANRSAVTGSGGRRRPSPD